MLIVQGIIKRVKTSPHSSCQYKNSGKCMFCPPSIQKFCLLDLQDVLTFTCELSFIKNVCKRILQLALSLNMAIFYLCFYPISPTLITLTR